MKILSPRIHGFIDYAVFLAFALAPTLFGFVGAPRIIAYAIAGVHLALTLLTAFPLGAIKAIPFKVHGAIEVVIVPVLIALPWVFGFSDVPVARNFFLVAAGALALTVLITDYEAAREPSILAKGHHPAHT